MAEKRRSRGPSPLHALLWKTLPPEARGYLVLEDIQRSWKELAGPLLGGCSLPVTLRDNTLLVRAEHPAAGQELQFQERRILKAIRQKFSLELTRLRVSIGPVSFSSPRPPSSPQDVPKRRVYVSSGEIRREGQVFEDAVEDEELRKALGKLRAVYKKRFSE